MRELTVQLSETLLERLQTIAKNQHTPLETVVESALEQYIESEEELEDAPDPTPEEILRMIEASEEEIKAGKIKTIEQVLAEIREELAQEMLGDGN
jgi:predicted transcriptional regulator